MSQLQNLKPLLGIKEEKLNLCYSHMKWQDDFLFWDLRN
jgi:hypothetical protein